MSYVIPVLYGSVRSHREGLRVAKYLTKAVADRGHEAVLVDPAEDELPMLDKMAKEYDSPADMPPAMGKLHELFERADGFVVVSAEYNHVPPPALTNMLGTFQTEFFYKPSGIVGYSVGSFGGVRAAMTLRCLLAELGMSSVPTILPFPKMTGLLDEAGEPTEGNAESLAKRTGKFLDEFTWYVAALAEARKAGTPG